MARRARHARGDPTPERAADRDPDGDLGHVAGSQTFPEEERGTRGESATAEGEHGLGERDQGPFDATELDMEQTDAVGRLDFGSVRVPMPDEAKLQVESAPGGRLKAVHVLVPLGRISISALAAPRSEQVWPDLAGEIVAALKQDGAWVRWGMGPWGRELGAGTASAQCRFIGVDGPRWMLYGVATGPAGGGGELTEILRDMIRGTIVVRDEQPYPVRTVLPLTAPAHLSAQLEKLQIEEQAQPEVTPPSEPLRPVQPAQPEPSAQPEPPAARPVAPPPAAAAVAPAPPAWSEPGWQPPYAGPFDSGSFPRHLPDQREASAPAARRPVHSNPGTAASLPLQPESPGAPERPESANLHEFQGPAGPQQPPRGVRRRPRRPADEDGLPTPPSWRAIDDALDDPPEGWPNDPEHQRLDYLGVGPLNDPLGDGDPTWTEEIPPSSGLSDQPQYPKASEPDRRSGRHRLPD